MERTLTEQELRSDRRGKIAAGIGFIAFIALLIIPIFFYQNPPPGQPGILVNLGFMDQGQGEENAGPAAPAEPTPEPPQPRPEPTTLPPPPPAEPTRPDPQPTAPEVIQTEDPAKVALERQREREAAAQRAEENRIRQQREAQRRREQAERDAEARRQREEQERLRQEREAAAAAQAAREAEANATKDAIGGLFGSGGGRGETGKPGNQGVENGDPNADALRGMSTSDGRVSGGLGGRGVLRSPPVREASQEEGVVMVRVCVNADGNIESAEFSQRGSRGATPRLIAAARANARKWKFSPGTVDRQCGEIKYDFRVQ